MTSKTTPKDDLMQTTEHTILNIRAHQDPSDSDQDTVSKDGQSKSTRVEYHSDKGHKSHRDYFMRQTIVDEDDVYGSK